MLTGVKDIVSDTQTSSAIQPTSQFKPETGRCLTGRCRCQPGASIRRKKTNTPDRTDNNNAMPARAIRQEVWTESEQPCRNEGIPIVQDRYLHEVRPLPYDSRILDTS